MPSNNTFTKYFGFIDSSREYVLWLKTDNKRLDTNSHILFGGVYISPDDSKYFNIDLHDEFVSEVTTFPSEFTYVCKTGDFNGRTNVKSDFINVDNDIDNDKKGTVCIYKK